VGGLQGQGLAVALGQYGPELLQAGELAPVAPAGQGLLIAAAAAPMNFSGGNGAGHGDGRGTAWPQGYHP